MIYLGSLSQSGGGNPGLFACKALAFPSSSLSAPSANLKGCTFIHGGDHIRVRATGGPVIQRPARLGFLSPHTTEVATLLWGCPMYCRMLGSFPGFHPLVVSNTTIPSWTNMSADTAKGPQGRAAKSPGLRNTVVTRMDVCYDLYALAHFLKNGLCIALSL